MSARFLLVVVLACAGCERPARPDAPPAAAQPAAAAFDTARMLFDSGTVELAREGYDSASIEYMKARPQQFFYNEFHDFYAYNGYHFRELVRRFPDSELAPAAAYQLTRLKSEFQECEGWIPCYIHIEWDPIARFLTAYPASSYADSAVERGLAVFGENVERARNPDDPYEFDAAELDTLLMGFDSVTQALPARLRARADSALRQWRSQTATGR